MAKGHDKQAEHLTSAYEDAAPTCASPNTPTSQYHTHTFPVTSSFLAGGSVARNMRRPPTHAHICCWEI